MTNKKPTAEHNSDLLDGIGESLKRFGDSKDLLQKVLDTIPQTVFWKDLDLNYLGCNQLFAEQAGKSCPAELIGLSDFDLAWKREDSELYRECDRRIMDNDEAAIGTIEPQINADGKMTWLATNKVPLHNDEGEVIGILGTYHDITRLKEAEEMLQRDNEELERRVAERTRELKFAANHDTLTGLANRRHFNQQLSSVIGESDAQNNIALLFLDLDDFKPINDSEGHDAGDQLLVQVASILSSSIGPDDFAGRIGGDEFLVLMQGLEDQSDATCLCNDVRNKLNNQIFINGRRVMITASMGIVFCQSRDYHNCDDLINNADLAMYSAKGDGKNNQLFFEPWMRVAAATKEPVGKQIINGVNRQEFVLHYQPIVNLNERRIRSFEALVRWQHSERGLVPPADFISIAERTGTIVQLGQQILESACQQLLKWKSQQGSAAKDLKVNINLSPRQLREPDFVAGLANTVTRLGVEPSSLCLEVTETLLLDNSQAAINVLREIKQLGFEIHLDDFGTGYSSLNYLEELPVDALKIDRSFVSRFDSERSENAVVEMIIALAETLEVSVIAEGIENSVQADILKSMNCFLVQGYYYSKPLPVDDATEFLINFQSPQGVAALTSAPQGVTPIDSNLH